MKKVMLDCEIASRFTLPALRMSVAMELYKMGMAQMHIADILGVKQAAISDYLNGKLAPNITEIAKDILSSGMAMAIAQKIFAAPSKDYAISIIDEAASDGKFITIARSYARKAGKI